MKELDYQQAASVFARYVEDLPSMNGAITNISPINGGLINHSWKIECPHKPNFLLQRINTAVFHQPKYIQQNYISIWQYAEFEFTGLRLPTPLYYSRTENLYHDDQGNYWRAFEFIDEAYTIGVAQKPAQAKATAKTFAKFTAAFDDFNTDQLKVVIPNFHNLSFRFSQLEAALSGEQYERLAKASTLIKELKDREKYKHFYELITESPESFRTRVMHHDAKIANVLFSKKTGKVICAVDFDTVMPGYYFSDIGDIIRSMACSEDENCIHPDKIEIRADFYDSIISGYLEVMGKHLTEAEKKYIHHAGVIMIYMQALRFLIDYLNGDKYYRIYYPEQNFDRALNQLTLLRKLEIFLEKNYNYCTYKSLSAK
jgi:thiamine kinase-like enzyme